MNCICAVIPPGLEVTGVNVFDLCATISIKIDDFEKGVEKAKDKMTDLADKVKSVGKGISSFASTVGKGFNAVSSVGEKALTGLKTAGTVAAAGITAATAAVTALGKASIDSYAEQEQLVGGVETLFGAGGKTIEEYAASVGKTVEEIRYDYAAMMEGQEKILENAAGAYKTAGLSANEYMETVTSFAAALVSSLGGQKDIAADVANTAIGDMADNANKMGTSMESIQNAYQGFAKQNYTMLDNLKLGFGGTKEEMQRLLDNAGELTGREFDISNFADIVDAIHAV